MDVFAGSCVVGLNADFDTVHFNDLNQDLIAFYKLLKNDSDTFITELESFFISDNNHADTYYKYRSEFNEETDSRRRAALLFYLSRHSFNALIRFNSKGHFNAPFGRYKKPYFPESELLYFASQCHRFTFSALHYEKMFNDLSNSRVDVCKYCDPPYSPLTETANFASYQSNGFGAIEHMKLATLCEQAAMSGQRVVVSNHSTPFTRNLYKNAKQYRFSAPRTISSSTGNRVPAKELLATY